MNSWAQVNRNDRRKDNRVICYLRSIIGPAKHLFKSFFIRFWRSARFVYFIHRTHCLYFFIARWYYFNQILFVFLKRPTNVFIVDILHIIVTQMNKYSVYESLEFSRDESNDHSMIVSLLLFYVFDAVNFNAHKI